MSEDIVGVEQADRDMAAEYAMRFLRWNRDVVDAMDEGRADEDALIQAFARHRIAAAAHTNRGEVERLRDALEPFAELADNFVGEDEDDDDLYSPPLYEHQMRVRIGWLRAALAALSSPDTVVVEPTPQT